MLQITRRTATALISAYIMTRSSVHIPTAVAAIKARSTKCSPYNIVIPYILQCNNFQNDQYKYKSIRALLTAGPVGTRAQGPLRALWGSDAPGRPVCLARFNV